jgi:hypothetical protein
MAAELLDDALRTGERSEARTSVRAIAERVGVDESLVRVWRDPSAPKHARLSLLLQLPGETYRALVAGIAAARRDLYGEEPGAATCETQASVTLAALGELVAEIGRGLGYGRISAEEGDIIRTRAQAARTTIEQLLARLPAAR